MRFLQNKNSIALHILAIFIILAFFYSYAIASVNTYPTQGWRNSTPEMQGMKSQMLADMMKHIKKTSSTLIAY